MVSWPPPLPKTKEIVINFGKRGSVQAPVSISGAEVQMVENFQVPVSKHHQCFVLYQPYCSDSPESTPLQHLYNTSEDQEGAACFNISHRCIIETIGLCASQLRRGLLCPRPQKITKSCNHNTVHRTKQPPSPPLSTPCTLRAASGKQPTLSRTIFTPVIPFSFLSSLLGKKIQKLQSIRIKNSFFSTVLRLLNSPPINCGPWSPKLPLGTLALLFPALSLSL